MFLFLGDLIILLFSLWLTLLIRYGTVDSALWQSHFWPFAAIMATLLIIFYIEDLYEIIVGKGRTELFNRLFQSAMIGSALAIVFFYLGYNRLFSIKPQRVFFIYIAIVMLLTYLWRLWFLKIASSPKIADGILLIGFNNTAGELVQKIIDHPELSLKIKSIILDQADQTVNIPEKLRGLVSNQNINNLKEICVNQEIQTIISTTHPRENPELLKNLFNCLALKINFYDIAVFYEKITGKIPVTSIEQIWFLENLTEHNKRAYDAIKRIIDIVVSAILLVISLPIIPLITLAIKLNSKGPVFFTQIRTGKDGKNFIAIKFRTMIYNAESSGPQWATKNDPRVTKVGKFLRKTRIDEIPQLINILKNEMGLIGPRPERPEFIEQLQQKIPFYKERLLIKPGLTGWAQVVGPAYGGSFEETTEKIQYDLFYIKNRSLGLDLSIILKTIRIIFSRRGQ